MSGLMQDVIKAVMIIAGISLVAVVGAIAYISWKLRK